MTLHNQHVRHIEQITEDLRKVKLKIQMLGDMQGLSSRQKQAVESLRRGIDDVRGWDIGAARQSFGLDEDLIELTARIKGKSK